MYDLPPEMVMKDAPQQVNGVVELRLTLPRRRLAGFGGFDYRAGQYASLRVPEISRLEWHPFTISSAPCDDFLMFHIKAVGAQPRYLPASLLSPWLCNLHPFCMPASAAVLLMHHGCAAACLSREASS